MKVSTQGSSHVEKDHEGVAGGLREGHCAPSAARQIASCLGWPCMRCSKGSLSKLQPSKGDGLPKYRCRAKPCHIYLNPITYIHFSLMGGAPLQRRCKCLLGTNHRRHAGKGEAHRLWNWTEVV